MAVIEGEFAQDQWDKKKIFIGSFIIFVLIATGVVYLKQSHLLSSRAALGVSTQKETANSSTSSTSSVTIAPLPKVDVQQKLNDLKKEVNNLDVTQFAQNSPQMKKVLHDLQSIQALPHDQAKQVCEQICKGI